MVRPGWESLYSKGSSSEVVSSAVDDKCDPPKSLIDCSNLAITSWLA